jgi:hypothetical protein
MLSFESDVESDATGFLAARLADRLRHLPEGDQADWVGLATQTGLVEKVAIDSKPPDDPFTVWC